jgi:hypothetical protein
MAMLNNQMVYIDPHHHATKLRRRSDEVWSVNVALQPSSRELGLLCRVNLDEFSTPSLRRSSVGLTML